VRFVFLCTRITFHALYFFLSAGSVQPILRRELMGGTVLDYRRKTRLFQGSAASCFTLTLCSRNSALAPRSPIQ
jgi:hypothetical protein